MKNYTSALLIATILLASIFETSCTSPSHITTENTVVSTEIGFNSFHDELAPYGHWAYIPSYGQVWMSNTQGFVPYSTGGHWAYTSYGWTWASDYAWGWAPFHYGRWAFEGGYGWVYPAMNGLRHG